MVNGGDGLAIKQGLHVKRKSLCGLDRELKIQTLTSCTKRIVGISDQRVFGVLPL